MPKKFLSVHDVARLLGVSPLTIRNWDQKGKLTAYRNPFNNYRMYKIEDVEVILKEIDQSKGAGGNRNRIEADIRNKPRKIKIELE